MIKAPFTAFNHTPSCSINDDFLWHICLGKYPSVSSPLVQAQVSGSLQIKGEKQIKFTTAIVFCEIWNYWQWIPTKCMEVHFSQRLILGEWSWSLHRATENVATVPVKKRKNGGKKCIKSPQSLSALSQWVQQDKTDKRVTIYSVVMVLLWKAQPSEFPLT